MNFPKTLSFVALLLGAAVAFTGCRKDQKKELTCQLVSAAFTTDTHTGAYQFTYNSNNKITRIVSAEDEIDKTLTYSGNTVTIINQIENSVTEKVVLTLNSAGRVVRQEDRDPATDSVLGYSAYSYNANGELQSATNNYGTTGAAETTLTNRNGNIISANSRGRVSEYEYYEEEPNRPGDYFDLLQRLTVGNNFFITNKNLVKLIGEGSGTQLSYTFDDNKNISTLKILEGGKTETVTYRHQCQ